jgi:hypothetical protein
MSSSINSDWSQRLGYHASSTTELGRAHPPVLLPCVHHPHASRFVSLLLLSLEKPDMYAACIADFAELNAPPMVNYGAVYPQAILVFVITILYSVIQPLILFFGAAFFGISYVVYKYKVLFGASILTVMTKSNRLLTYPVQSSTSRTNPKVRRGPSRLFG